MTYLLQCDNAAAYFLLATEWRMANEIIINTVSLVISDKDKK